MGCFSFKCKVCDEPINSDSRSGEHCTLYLLQDGKVIEQMTGQYDSYGRVFDSSMESVQWGMKWGAACALMYLPDKGNGIAAVHSDCYCSEVPTTRSEDDPDQGWGKYKHATEAPSFAKIPKPKPIDRKIAVSLTADEWETVVAAMEYCDAAPEAEDLRREIDRQVNPVYECKSCGGHEDLLSGNFAGFICRKCIFIGTV